MRRFLLALVLAVMPFAADAANVEAERMRYAVCIEAGGSHALCYMQHFPEVEALQEAHRALEFCARAESRIPWHPVVADCPDARAYIRQRWGVP